MPCWAGSFAAASNLTGALEDTDAITEILHRGGALSFWDYATAAPYVEMDMNPDAPKESDNVSRERENVLSLNHTANDRHAKGFIIFQILARRERGAITPVLSPISFNASRKPSIKAR